MNGGVVESMCFDDIKVQSDSHGSISEVFVRGGVGLDSRGTGPCI